MAPRASSLDSSDSTADLRQQTLDVARRLIGHHGYRDVSMRDIAAEVGCSVSTLYFHFQNRDALLHALIDEGFERWYGELLALRAAHEDPLALLEAIARRYIEFGLANPELYEIMYLFHPQSMQRMPRELFRRIRRSLDLTADTVEQCAAPGTLGTEESRATAAAIWATLHGVVATLLTQRLDTRIDRTLYIECAVRSVLATARAVRNASNTP